MSMEAREPWGEEFILVEGQAGDEGWSGDGCSCGKGGAGRKAELTLRNMSTHSHCTQSKPTVLWVHMLELISPSWENQNALNPGQVNCYVTTGFLRKYFLNITEMKFKESDWNNK